MLSPKIFLWGASSSDYQVEGVWNEEERGLTVMDIVKHDAMISPSITTVTGAYIGFPVS